AVVQVGHSPDGTQSSSASGRAGAGGASGPGPPEASSAGTLSTSSSAATAGRVLNLRLSSSRRSASSRASRRPVSTSAAASRAPAPAYTPRRTAGGNPAQSVPTLAATAFACSWSSTPRSVATVPASTRDGSVTVTDLRVRGAGERPFAVGVPRPVTPFL